MKKLFVFFPIAALVLIFSACNNNAESAATSETKDVTAKSGGQESVQDDVSQKDVVKIAVGSKDHTTLVAALKQADYVDDLSNAGPFTVFAPTNDAIKSQLKFHEREYLMGKCGGGLNDLDIWTKHHLHYDNVLYSDTFNLGDTNGLI